ncbi:response regulator transcription factor [Planomonospora algeriensis]
MIKTMVADSWAMTRSALVSLLHTAPGIDVVGDVSRAGDIVTCALNNRATVAVLDVDSLGPGGFEAAAQLAVRAPACRALILSGTASAWIAGRAATARASGFLLKDAPANRLLESIRSLSAGYTVMDYRFTAPQLVERLTAREVDVLRMAADGADVTTIADQLCLATGTVRNNLSRIVSKLNARTRVDAVRMGRELGLI